MPSITTAIVQMNGPAISIGYHYSLNIFGVLKLARRGEWLFRPVYSLLNLRGNRGWMISMAFNTCCTSSPVQFYFSCGRYLRGSVFLHLP